MRFLFLFIFFLATDINHAGAQQTTPAAQVADSITNAHMPLNSTLKRVLQLHPYYNFKDAPKPLLVQQRVPPPGREFYFYSLLGVMLLLAAFRSGFEGYFSNLSGLFFKRNLNQRQLKQQLTQQGIISLLLNIFFFVIAGFYIALYISRHSGTNIDFSHLLIYCMAGVAGIYFIKYLTLLFIGWVFGCAPVMKEYEFNIFYVNKLLGLALIPILLLASLSTEPVVTIAFTLSWFVLGAAAIYRAALTLPLIRKSLSTQPFLFLSYFILLEIIPLLALLKVMKLYM